MKTSRIIATFILLVLGFTQCQVRPSMVLDRDQMKAITRDMLMVDAYLMEHNVEDSLAVLYYESILSKHHISRAKYDSSLVWYGENAPIYMSIYQELLTEFQSSAALLDSAYLDSLEMDKIKYMQPQSDWSGSSRIMLAPHQKLAVWRVVLPYGMYRSGDTLELHVRVLPSLRDGELLVSRLFMSDSAQHRVGVLSDTISPTTPVKNVMSFILPPSLPLDGALKMQLIYINRSTMPRVPILMDSITFGKKKPLELIPDEAQGEGQPTDDGEKRRTSDQELDLSKIPPESLK